MKVELSFVSSIRKVMVLSLLTPELILSLFEKSIPQTYQLSSFDKRGVIASAVSEY